MKLATPLLLLVAGATAQTCDLEFPAIGVTDFGCCGAAGSCDLDIAAGQSVFDCNGLGCRATKTCCDVGGGVFDCCDTATGEVCRACIDSDNCATDTPNICAQPLPPTPVPAAPTEAPEATFCCLGRGACTDGNDECPVSKICCSGDGTNAAGSFTCCASSCELNLETFENECAAAPTPAAVAPTPAAVAPTPAPVDPVDPEDDEEDDDDDDKTLLFLWYSRFSNFFG